MDKLDLTGRESIFSSQKPGGIGAEIGVDWGTFSLRIMELAKPRLMYLVDCWEIQSSEVYGSDPANTQQDVKYRQCLQRYTTDERFRMVKAYSLEAAEVFPDGYFDWLYIDANHLQAYQDCCAWWPKVKTGGIIAGHDYYDKEPFRVRTALCRFVNGPCGITHEPSPSWWCHVP